MQEKKTIFLQFLFQSPINGYNGELKGNSRLNGDLSVFFLVKNRHI